MDSVTKIMNIAKTIIIVYIIMSGCTIILSILIRIMC